MLSHKMDFNCCANRDGFRIDSHILRFKDKNAIEILEIFRNLVVNNLLMYSLPGMILLYLAAPFFPPKVFLDEIIIYVVNL